MEGYRMDEMVSAIGAAQRLQESGVIPEGHAIQGRCTQFNGEAVIGIQANLIPDLIERTTEKFTGQVDVFVGPIYYNGKLPDNSDEGFAEDHVFAGGIHQLQRGLPSGCKIMLRKQLGMDVDVGVYLWDDTQNAAEVTEEEAIATENN